MAFVLGLNAVTALNSGTTAVPVYEIIENIRDENINLDTALADVTTRASNGFRMQIATLSEGSIEAQMVYNTADDDFEDVREAFFTRTRLLMGFFDGNPVTAGTQGLVGGFGVTNFSIARELENAMLVDVTFTARENDVGAGPAWVTIAA